MITTVSLNPSIDLMLKVDKFNFGALNRVSAERRDAGGKGLNVALVAAQIGCDVECIGFLHKETSQFFEHKLIANSASYDFVYLDGSTRTNIKLFEGESGTMTEINQGGRPVNEDNVKAMTEKVLQHAELTDYLVLSGSMPPGCPAGYYRELIEAMDGLGCRCVLDADGERLAEGVKAKPFMIKPNRFELEMITGKKLLTLADVRNAAMRYIDEGIEVVAVSLGEKGALITNGEETLFAPRMNVEVQSTVGAGDAMVAGLTAGFLGENDLETAFRMGVACASATCMTEGTKIMDKQVYKTLLKQVEIEKV